MGAKKPQRFSADVVDLLTKKIRALHTFRLKAAENSAIITTIKEWLCGGHFY